VMDQAEWTAAHVEAFAFFAGVPARLVPDNLNLIFNLGSSLVGLGGLWPACLCA
jgi:hypothetical protein